MSEETNTGAADAAPVGAQDGDDVAVIAAEQVVAQRKELRTSYDARGGRAGLSRYALAGAMADLPSDPPLYEVMIDTFGSAPTFRKGDLIEPEDAGAFDLGWAETQGAIRRISMAEARVYLPGGSTSRPLAYDNQGVDAALAKAGPVMAGLVAPEGALADELGRPVTIDGAPGPDEDPARSKSTVPAIDGAPAGRPVIHAAPGETPADALERHLADRRDRVSGSRSAAKPKAKAKR